MKNIKFIKEPGYIFDLIFLFVLNFNKDFCLTNFINYNKSNEDTDFYNKILLDFNPISDDLLPFFYIKEDGKCFFTQFYFDPYINEFTTTYNLATVQTNILNHEQLITYLIKFYFMEISEEALNECKNSVIAIGKLIKNSKYNDTIKSTLYAFFLDPAPVIQKLSYELMSKEFLLSQQYEKNFRKITELQNQFNDSLVFEKLKLSKYQKSNLDDLDNIYISFCINNKNCIKTSISVNFIILLFGVDYLSCLEYIISQNRIPELDSFGNAISESNRIDILNLILRKDEITIRDIEQELGFTGTNAYYHLSLMIRINMIKSRNQGRTILYSINKQYFDEVCDIVSKYSNNQKGV